MKYPYQIVRENKDAMQSCINREGIIRDFAEILNKYSLKNDSNTPDFILAEYLFDCLMAANILICGRSVWFNPENKT